MKKMVVELGFSVIFAGLLPQKNARWVGLNQPKCRRITELISLMAIGFVLQAFPMVANGDAIAEFKEFLENPPQIHEAQFSITDSFQYFGSNGDTVRHYQARWQTNAFFIRQLADSDAPSDLRIPINGTFYTKYENRYCYQSGDGTFRYWYDGGNEPRDKTTPPYHLTECDGKSTLGIVLNMGIFPAKIKTIKWNGTTFTAPPGCSEYQTEGKLVTASGFPSEIEFQYDHQGRSVRWLARYDYSKPLGGAAFLPSEFTILLKKDASTLVPFRKLVIHSLKIGKQNQESSFFSPDPFVSATLNGDSSRMLVFTNRQLFAFSQNGRSLFSLASLLSGPPPEPRRSNWPLIFWPAIFITTTVFFLLLIRILGKRREQTNKTT